MGLTGDPQGLASALRHIGDVEGRAPQRLHTGVRGLADALLRSHPPTEQRVDAVERTWYR